MLKYYVKTTEALKRLRTDKDGVVSFEYVIVAVCIVVAVLAAFGTDTTTGIGAALVAGSEAHQRFQRGSVIRPSDVRGGIGICPHLSNNGGSSKVQARDFLSLSRKALIALGQSHGLNSQVGICRVAEPVRLLHGLNSFRRRRQLLSLSCGLGCLGVNSGGTRHAAIASISNSSRFPPSPASPQVTPVKSPPGCEKLSTISSPTGSGTKANTTGIFSLASLSAIAAGDLKVRQVVRLTNSYCV